MSRPRTLLLFDIDGTLLTGGAGIAAVARVGVKMFGPAFRCEVGLAGRLDSEIFAELAALNGLGAADADALRRAYPDELAREVALRPDPARALPGARELVGALAARADVAVGLVTGNYRASAPIKLRAAGFDPAAFGIGAFGCEGRIRADLVRLALDRYAARYASPCAPRDAIVIGDTPRDVECARAHGCRVLAVATGQYAADALARAGADRVAPDLTDPAPLLALMAE